MEHCSYSNSIYLDVIKSYFTADEWNKLSEHEQRQVILLYDSYKALTDYGIKAELPSYMKKQRVDDSKEWNTINSTYVENIRNKNNKRKKSPKVLSRNGELNENKANVKVVNEEQDGCTVKEQCKSKISDKKLSTNQKLRKPNKISNTKKHLQIETVHDTDKQNLIIKEGYRNLSTCTYCKYSCSRKYDLMKHIERKHLKTKKYKCELCDFSTFYQESLKKHNNNIHLNIKEYKCKYCSYETSRKHCLVAHINSHHVKKSNMYQCEKCPFETAYGKSLITHNNSVHEKISYNCKICDRCFSQRGGLTRHMNSIHLNIKKYKCDHDCNYATASKQYLIAHINYHHIDNKEYKCNLCNYKTALKGNLTNHTNNIHKKIKNHKCTECSYQTYTRTHLTRHVNSIHLKLKPFQCPYCQYRTTQNAHLNSHIKKVHQQRRIIKEKHKDNIFVIS